VVELLQQVLDADEAQYEVAFSRIEIAGEVEAGAEVVAVAVNDQQPRAVGVRVLDRVEQRFDERRRQRVRFLRPVQRQMRDVDREESGNCAGVPLALGRSTVAVRLSKKRGTLLQRNF